MDIHLAVAMIDHTPTYSTICDSCGRLLQSLLRHLMLTKQGDKSVGKGMSTGASARYDALISIITKIAT